MDLNNIKAFVTVADTLSFSEAAELLFITQPAVSKRIASMEHALSIKLFDRMGRRIILTETGESILAKCRLILDTIDDTAKIINNRSGEITGILSIGTSHHIGLHHLLPVVRNYVRMYPKVEMDIQFLSSEQVCEMVSTGDLELGVITLPLTIPEKLSANSLWHDPMQFVVSTSHPLSLQRTNSIDQLMEYNAILPDRGTYTYSIIEKVFTQKGLELKSKFTINYLETIKMMVSVGLGWSVLPETLVDEDLSIIHIPNIKISRQLGIVQHKQRTLSNAATAMSELLN